MLTYVRTDLLPLCLIRSGYCLIIYYIFGEFNNNHLFLTIPGTGKSKIKALTDLVCGEDTLPDSQMAVFFCIFIWYRAERGEANSLGSLCVGVINLTLVGTTWWHNYLSKALSPTAIALGLRICIHEFWEEAQIFSSYCAPFHYNEGIHCSNSSSAPAHTFPSTPIVFSCFYSWVFNILISVTVSFWSNMTSYP